MIAAWLLTAAIVTLGLRGRVGLGPALMIALAGSFVSSSALGIVLLDRDALAPAPVLVCAAAMLAGWALLVVWLRHRWPVPSASATATATATATKLERGLPVALVLAVLALGTGLRHSPSPYLHGGQDQGIYVNVGHHIARTGRLRPVDRLLAGEVPGVPAELIHASHEIEPLPEGSPLIGVREGRWIAGLHIEDASEGRLVPGFFHLLPVWFAFAELQFGFARSTWPLVLFSLLVQLAALALGYRITAGDTPDAAAHRRGLLVGCAAALGLALHPLDLWISTFPVTETLARGCLLGAAALGLEAARAERLGRPGAVLLAVLAGLVFAAGAFTRGSMLALAIVLALSLMIVPGDTPRSRRALLIALVVGSTLAAIQAIVHSWPYFFSAASNHFYVPRIRPFKSEAVAWAAVAGGSLLLLDHGISSARHGWPKLTQTDRPARVLGGLALALALMLVLRHGLDQHDAYAMNQQVSVVLLRHSGPVALLLGLAGVVAGLARTRGQQLSWMLLACAIVLATAVKQGIRYEFYYARYLVGDVIPVLTVASACMLGELARRVPPQRASLVIAVVLLAWHAPGLSRLRHPVYWTRDLEHGPEDLRALFDQVPDDAILVFDAREPGRWRGILATPALLSFAKTVMVYPNTALVERAITAGTPVYLLSGGWEPEDHQRWPTPGPWHTTVVARGIYRAQRAEIVEGAMPERLTEWGGPWELQRFDPSIWRPNAFSLYPGSRFVARADDAGIASAPLELRWQPGDFVELLVEPHDLDGCEVSARLHANTDIALARTDSPTENRLRFAMPTDVSTPLDAAIELSWRCDRAPEVRWRRLSVRTGGS